ncbi:hypothetical protein UPYG_G00344960 [Umbra pygmaea]|uniref:Uncharacterized protein n=1 Tax=Umbra pygmaea TaxID=75934 RepID=A0ABD0WJJ8_UMBPY
MPRHRVDECHRAVTSGIVRGMLPFSTVEAPWFREMIGTLKPKYCPPSRDLLSNTLIPSWYTIECRSDCRWME